jgi:Holliday junction resolvase-like predicted endonuclease
MSSNYQTGHDAEKAAAQYLKDHGYKILELNWKTKYCEIDIVAQKDKRVYLVEVKSRKTLFQGSGMDYITTKKLSQMRFAAEMWVSDHKWHGDYQLAAMSIDSGVFEFTEIDA